MRGKRKTNKNPIKSRSSRCKEESRIAVKSEISTEKSENSEKFPLCHLCLCKSENSRPLFEENSKKVLENIKAVFQIEPIQDNAAPDQICTHCIEKIDDFIVFRQLVLDNHQKLKLEVEEARDVVVLEPYIKMEEGNDDQGDDDDYSNDNREDFEENEPNEEESDSLPTRTWKLADKDDGNDIYLRKYYCTFECPKCSKTFPRFRALRSHARVDHKFMDLTIACYRPDCDSSFKQRSELLYHLRRHETSDVSYQCNHCSAIYHRKGPLKRHFEVYHHFVIDDRPTSRNHQCPQCSKTYLTEGGLQTHIRLIHKRAEEVICHVCAKIFHQKAALKYHYNSFHTDLPKVICQLCGKALANQNGLAAHMRRTHWHQPTKCEICSKVLRSREQWRRHMKYSHEAPKFICPECGKAFPRKMKLTEHMTSHGVGGDLYKCEWCDKTFNFSSSKSLHKKTQHPVEWQQSRIEAGYN